jgi:hypothetical protein
MMMQQAGRQLSECEDEVFKFHSPTAADQPCIHTQTQQQQATFEHAECE